MHLLICKYESLQRNIQRDTVLTQHVMDGIIETKSGFIHSKKPARPRENPTHILTKEAIRGQIPDCNIIKIMKELCKGCVHLSNPFHSTDRPSQQAYSLLRPSDMTKSGKDVPKSCTFHKFFRP